jgi:hypothetical protein
MAGSHLAARLTGVLLKVAKPDTYNAPGHRCAADGDLRRLEGFEFNEVHCPPALADVRCGLLNSRQGDRVLVKTDAFSADVFLTGRVLRATHFKVRLIVAAIPLNPRLQSRVYASSTDSLLRAQRIAPSLQVLTELLIDEMPVVYCAALAVSFYRFAGSLSCPYQQGKQDLLRLVKAFSA